MIWKTSSTGEFKTSSKYICDDLALETFWRIFSQTRARLCPHAKFWISPKTIELIWIIWSLNICCKIFAGLHHFQNSGKTAWCIIEILLISHNNLSHYEMIPIIQFKGDFLANNVGVYQSEWEKAKCCVRRKEEKQEERVSRSLSNRTPPRPHHYHCHCWYNFYWISTDSQTIRKTIDFFVAILSIDFNRTRNTNLLHFDFIGRCSTWRKKSRMVQCWKVRDGQLFPLRLHYYLSLSLIMVSTVL